jgi:hypothetical protein
VAEREAERLISLAEHPVLSWRWKVDRLADEEPDARPERQGPARRRRLGREARRADREEGGWGAHEIAYVWTRPLPRETLLYQEARIALVYKVRSYRIVAGSGEERLSQWTSEQRDVAADFEAHLPGPPRGPRAAGPPHDRLGRHRGTHGGRPRGDRFSAAAARRMRVSATFGALAQAEQTAKAVVASRRERVRGTARCGAAARRRGLRRLTRSSTTRSRSALSPRPSACAGS